MFSFILVTNLRQLDTKMSSNLIFEMKPLEKSFKGPLRQNLWSSADGKIRKKSCLQQQKIVFLKMRLVQENLSGRWFWIHGYSEKLIPIYRNVKIIICIMDIKVWKSILRLATIWPITWNKKLIQNSIKQ